MPDSESTAWGADWQAERVTLGRHFLRDMEGLWRQILRLAALVETTLNTSVRALCDNRADLALEVKFEEQAIDTWEVQIERDCLKILALHQPVASDLRRVAAILRINSDLERMADLARHIAKRARKLAEEPTGRALPKDLEAMASESLEQVRESLDALTQGDVDLARAVIAGDRKVDRHRNAVVARRGAERHSARPARLLAPPDQRDEEPRTGRRPRHQHRRSRGLPQGRRHHPPRHLNRPVRQAMR